MTAAGLAHPALLGARLRFPHLLFMAMANPLQAL